MLFLFLLLLAGLALVLSLRARADRADEAIESLRREVEGMRAVLNNLRADPGVSRPRSNAAAAPAEPGAVASPPPLLPEPIPLDRAQALPPVLPPIPPRRDLVADLGSRLTGAGGDADTMEREIGERWLLYAGVVVLLLAVAFFLRYAFDRNWLSPVVRVGLGAVAGLALVVGGRQIATTGFRAYGLIVAGAGIAALYLATYAALNFYELLSPTWAFVLLVAISAAVAWMADREVAPALAIVAVCGGFATPFLVGGTQDAQVVLFTYVAVLIAAITWLGMRRDWWYLDLLSLALTILTVASWFVTFYTPVKAIRTELFLTLYCTMFLVILRGSLRWGSAPARDAARLLVAAPVLYHLSSIAILTPHHEAFLAYMILATAVALLIAEQTHSSVLRAIAWIAAALPLAGWIDARGAAWVGPSILTVVAVYVAHLAAQLNAIREDEPIRAPDLLVVHANGLGIYGALVILLETRAPQSLASIAAGLAAWHGALALEARRRRLDVAPHWAAVAATLAAIAVATQFDGPWVVVMWAVEAAAVIAIATRTGGAWCRLAGWGLMLIAVIRWLGRDVQQTSISATVLFNPRAASAGVMVLLLYGLAWWRARLPGARPRSHATELAVAVVGASALTVALLSREIIAYWDVRALGGEVVYIARQAMLSAAWSIYAAAAIAIGMRRRYAPIRYFAIALFGVTLAKVFAIDLSTLGGVYRIVAFFVIGVVLLFASFLYQRRRAVGGE